MSPTVLRFLGGVINFIGLFSAHLAGRIAFFIFSRTSNREPKSDKERAIMEAAAPVFATAVRQQIPLSHSGAVAHIFPRKGLTDGPRILVTHGWASSAVFMLGLIEGLREAGAEVVALDLPGHGAAPGRRLHAPMAVEAISKASEMLGPFDMMIGHSLGGYMTAASVKGVLPGLYKPEPRKLVTIASPSDVRVVFKNYARMLGMSKRVHDAMVAHVESIAGRPLDAFFGPKLLENTGIEALILHAEDDKEVHALAARQYAEAGSHVHLEWLNGLGHRRIVNSPEALAAITRFAA